MLEKLETRRLLSAVYPTADEQYLVELINRARANPAAEAARDGIDLNEGLPAGTITADAKQPLAINLNLVDSAEQHAQYMLAAQIFSHYVPAGTDPGTRDAAAGYAFAGTYGWGENIAERGTLPAVPNPDVTTLQEHNDLFVDSTVTGRGHRTNMLDPTFKEVGAGVSSGSFKGYNTVMASEDFAYSSGESFLTGVAYSDTVRADQFYTPGEGLGGVNVVATRLSDGATYSTTTWAAGGYSLQLPAGTYSVVASGGNLGGAVIDPTVTIGDQNVEADFTPAQAKPVYAALGADGVLAVTGTLGNDTVSVNLGPDLISVVTDGVLQTFPFSQVKGLRVYTKAGKDSVTLGPGVGAATLGGGPGDDTLVGAAGDDEIHGGAGNDLIQGGGGNDTIYAAGGENQVFAGAGNDQIHTGDGNSTLVGGAGDDAFFTTPGFHNVLRGGAGTNAAHADAMTDFLGSIQTLLA